jgi:predicted dehydrogenase
MALCPVAKYHHIEVEDEALIVGEYQNGATLTFHTSTGEYPGTNRLEITGDGGKLVLEEGKLKLWRLRERERDYCFTATEGFGHIPLDYEEFTFPAPNGHGTILQNFVDHIERGVPLISDGREALNEVLLANSAYLSAWQGNWVDIPFDEAAFDELLAAKATDSAKTGEATPSLHKDYQERWQVRW